MILNFQTRWNGQITDFFFFFFETLTHVYKKWTLLWIKLFAPSLQTKWSSSFKPNDTAFLPIFLKTLKEIRWRLTQLSLNVSVDSSYFINVINASRLNCDLATPAGATPNSGPVEVVGTVWGGQIGAFLLGCVCSGSSESARHFQHYK